MRLEFFLDVADNTGDGFSYKILTAVVYSDIPLGCHTVTLIRSVVSIRNWDSLLESYCRRTDDKLPFYDQREDELIGDTEFMHLPDQLSSSPDLSSSEDPPPKRLK